MKFKFKSQSLGTLFATNFQSLLSQFLTQLKEPARPLIRLKVTKQCSIEYTLNNQNLWTKHHSRHSTHTQRANIHPSATRQLHNNNRKCSNSKNKMFNLLHPLQTEVPDRKVTQPFPSQRHLSSWVVGTISRDWNEVKLKHQRWRVASVKVLRKRKTSRWTRWIETRLRLSTLTCQIPKVQMSSMAQRVWPLTIASELISRMISMIIRLTTIWCPQSNLSTLPQIRRSLNFLKEPMI